MGFGLGPWHELSSADARPRTGSPAADKIDLVTASWPRRDRLVTASWRFRHFRDRLKKAWRRLRARIAHDARDSNGAGPVRRARAIV